jgi:GTP-binding protein
MMQFTRNLKKLAQKDILKQLSPLSTLPSQFKTINGQQYRVYYFSTSSSLGDAAALNPPPTPTQDAKVLEVLNLESTIKFRNIAIIAHVDHGKTTLVDSLLRQSGAGKDGQTMDSNQLEKEKGITILSKCTGVTYKGFKINIVDTPGHHDFGGEVERIMSMVDGVALIICAVEGPMSQTKFVLQKALKQNLKPIVIINKVDRKGARVKEVENEVFDLFCNLSSNDNVLDYPVFYASGRDGWAVKNMDDEKKDVKCIFDGILEHIPPPKVDTTGNFTMLVSQTESNSFFGKMLIGRITSGQVKVKDPIFAIDLKGQIVEHGRVFKIIRRYGMAQVEMAKAVAGDIVSIAGLTKATVTNTLNEPGKSVVIPSIPIDPPMLSIFINANNSPLVGREGDKISVTGLRDRLLKEAENDVALRVLTSENKDGGIELQGRGDLHLGILIENMRREGFEMSVTPPSVMMKKNAKGQVLEPIEEVTIEINYDHSATIIDKIQNRKGVLNNCVEIDKDRQRMTFHVPTRALLGFRAELLHDTKGTASIQTQFLEYQDFKGPLKKQQKGAIISIADGKCPAYGLKEVENKGTLFIKTGQQVYNGMVIGEHKNDDDVELNPTKEKKLTNVRSTGADEKIVLTPPRVFTLEDAISYVRDDEIIEVTPQNIRIRKIELDPTIRKKNRRNARNERQRFL